MKRLSAVAAFMVMVLLSGIAGATVLNFDDLVSGPAIADGYGGLNWDNYYSHSGTHPYYTYTGYRVGCVSLSTVIYNAWGNEASISKDSTFDFNGAYLTGAFRDGLNIRVRGYSGSELLYDTSVVASATVATYFSFNYEDIDRLVFTSSGGISYWPNGDGTCYAMDNFTFNEPINGTAPVPEPATMFLLGAGIIGLVGFRNKLEK